MKMMAAMGLTLDQAITLAEQMERDHGPSQSTGAIRQRRYRERKASQNASHGDVTRDVTADVTKGGDGSPKDINQTPSLPPKGSEADASGGTPPGTNIVPISDPIELKRMAFRSGLRVLTDGGTPEAQARSMIGKWRRDFGDGAVLDVLARCHAEAPEEPIPWITATLRNRYGRKSAHPAPELDSNNALLAASLRALAADGRA